MILDFRELPPESANAPKQLIFLLHGYGSNADDLITLAPDLRYYLPDAHFISFNAPYEYEGVNMLNARQWFSLSSREPEFMLEGARKSAPILLENIEMQLRRFNLCEKNTALLGFSQGSMMSLHTAFRMPLPVKAVLAYSGYLLAPELLATELQSKPEIMLVHGAEDTVVDPIALGLAKKTLTAYGVKVHTLLRPQLAHGIDSAGIHAGGAFLKQAFADTESNTL